jgi:1-acyl-sn-glycerol-3-phosphate acyltransferase
MRFALADVAPSRARSSFDRAIETAGLVYGVTVRARVLPEDQAASSRVRARSLMNTCDRLLEIHGVRADVHGRLPVAPLVLVANHVSYLDPILLARLLPSAPIAKAEVERWPFLGRAIDGLGAIFVDRASIESRARTLRRAFAALCSGASVINFPEGSTSSGRVVGPFHRGIFGIAIRAGVPIVPVRIDYSDPRIAWTGNASFLPHYLRVLRMRSIEARIRIGDPILAAPTRTPEELADQARATIQQLGDRS